MQRMKVCDVDGALYPPRCGISHHGDIVTHITEILGKCDS